MKVIFEDEYLICALKQSGIEHHGPGVVMAQMKEIKESIYGVHRLDRETSGLMLFAKNKEIAKSLSELFEKHLILKMYIGVSDKKPSKKQGNIKGDLVKSRGGSYRLTRTLLNPSQTKFISFKIGESNFWGFSLFPKTGKTHQLRVVLKSIGSVILGDLRYGSDAKTDRLHLHATGLSFKLNEVNYEFFEYPEDGDQFLAYKNLIKDAVKKNFIETIRVINK